eukprot:1177465-Prorocentrum_minimum.AAC.3
MGGGGGGAGELAVEGAHCLRAPHRGGRYYGLHRRHRRHATGTIQRPRCGQRASQSHYWPLYVAVDGQDSMLEWMLTTLEWMLTMLKWMLSAGGSLGLAGAHRHSGSDQAAGGLHTCPGPLRPLKSSAALPP